MKDENMDAEITAMQLTEIVDKSYKLLLETSDYIARSLEELISRVKKGDISRDEVEEEKQKIALLKNNAESLKRTIAESEEMLKIFKVRKTEKKVKTDKKTS